jgi:hypothetical protein
MEVSLTSSVAPRHAMRGMWRAATASVRRMAGGGVRTTFGGEGASADGSSRAACTSASGRRSNLQYLHA